MILGTFTLERFCGTEIFFVTEAILSYRVQEGGMAIILSADAEGPPVEYLPDTENLNGQPNAEWNWVVPFAGIDLLPGQTFQLPHDYDEMRQNYITNFYYVEHEGILDSQIEILAREDTKMRIRATGMVTDINYYDGSKPPTKIIVEAVFDLVELLSEAEVN